MAAVFTRTVTWLLRGAVNTALRLVLPSETYCEPSTNLVGIALLAQPDIVSIEREIKSLV